MDTYTINANGLPMISKSAAATLDYTFDFTAWLTAINDTIGSFSITASSGITVSNQLQNGSAVTVWLSGGTPNAEYFISCQIATAGGRVEQRTIIVNAVNSR